MAVGAVASKREEAAEDVAPTDAAAMLTVRTPTEGAETPVKMAAEQRSDAADNPKIPRGLKRKRLLPSGGKSRAARRRERRTEQELANAQHLLVAELRVQHAERAKVLRKKVQQVIAELREVADLLQRKPNQDGARIAAAIVQQEDLKERMQPLEETEDKKASRSEAATRVPATAQVPDSKPETITDAEWQKQVQRYAEKAPEVQQRRELLERLDVAAAAGRAAREHGRKRRPKRGYHYEQQGNYGDIELRTEADGQQLRVGQLRAVGSSSPSCLPTALLALSKTRTQEVRLDSCAQYSVAGEDLRRFGRCITRDAPVDVVEGFGGAVSRVLGVWRFTGTTQYQQRIVVDALLVEGQGDEFLIGEDWMLKKQVKMDFSSRELKYRDQNGQKVILPFICYGVNSLPQADGTRRAVVRLAKTVKLTTNTRRIVRVAVDAADGATGVFLPKVGGRRHLLMAPTVDTVKNGQVRIAVMNVEGRREKLPARESLGTWIPASKDMQILSLNGELERALVAEWVTTLRKQEAVPLKNEDQLDIGEMEASDRDLVVALLRQFSDIVEKKEGCPPLSKTGVVHHINTGDAAPIMERRRRHAVAEHAIIDKEVDTMMRNGVIEEGSGAWGFPVVLVKKKDGSVRFCIDYRSLNAITVKDVYPLPRVDETLEALHGAQRFTSLDLHAGYWQLGMAEEDKPKTAFTTRRGLFQFCRMPFGLCNAPSTFQRLMNCVLRGLTWICCLVYLDDVIIFTQGSVARHVVELAVVLERLAEAGLSLKATKCTFAATSMEYLGHDLTPEGIKPTSRLVKAVTDFPRPTNETEVRRFVALAGYYRRFMPEFSSRMAPLTKLLRKTSEWTWEDQQEEAFAWAKAWLSKKPVLIYPDYTLPFKLTTDASKTGLGAVLSQDHGSGDQPVAYASKVNSPRVAKYGISELECLAVVWAVRCFRPHLYGRKFTIVTDHSALKWLMTTKEPAGRLHR